MFFILLHVTTYCLSVPLPHSPLSVYICIHTRLSVCKYIHTRIIARMGQNSAPVAIMSEFYIITDASMLFGNPSTLGSGGSPCAKMAASSRPNDLTDNVSSSYLFTCLGPGFNPLMVEWRA